ncbi:uncharacterized protein LOC127576899 [Pristis pectinata]|uniref:uncharacterized protein LOC127576899 n=1 Tax=Pristis pectinata TaxID=685728 RepID=UPI00223D88F1|nr:uncharacterized protein LOC127576899 [Pristis pectinata]
MELKSMPVAVDFDLHLESHKTWLASRKFQSNRTDPAYCDEELEMQTINKEFAEKQEIFQQSMAEIATELALVNQHKESLQQQLNEREKTLNQERQDEEKSVKSAPHTTQASMSKVTSGSSGLGRGANPSSLEGVESQEDETLQEAFSDAFPANEVVLNKYSAMLYLSCNGGITYEEAKEGTVCLSCAEKASMKSVNSFVPHDREMIFCAETNNIYDWVESLSKGPKYEE